MKRATFIVLGAVIVFLAGWGASDIIQAKRVVITDMRTDEVRVSIGTDLMGNGHLVIKDWQGNTVFEVKGNTVTLPTAPTTGDGASTSTSPSPPPAASSGRVMTVKSVETITGDTEYTGRPNLLRTEAADLEATADQKAEEALRLTVPRSPYIRSGYITNRKAHDRWIREKTLEVKRKKKHLSTEVAKLRSTAKHKRIQADTLEKQANQPRQVIIGYDADRTIILRAERDLRQQMKGVAKDVCVTWRGQLIKTDIATETWSVRRIEVVACP